MANLPETPQWEEGVHQIEVSDPVLGGPDGISNRQAKQLASRTLYLKQKVEKGGTDLAAHIAAADPHTQYAPKASPIFTGTPTAPTPATNDNSKKLVTTEFVARAIAALIGTAPETLNTLKELAVALGNDPNFATTVLNKLAEKLAKDQNGADIPDPALFVKNLGLTDAKNYQGRLINVQVFTESGKYQKTVGTKKIRVRVQGAGGGGGSASSSSVSNSAFGSGGAAGAYAEVIIDDPGNTETVVIGAGGTAGTSGGSSSFGSFVFCYGGGAGVSDAGGSTQNLLGSGVLGAAPIITGGTKILNISGPNAGDVGIRLGGGMGIAGKGSSSVLSSSGYARITTSPGQSPAGYGAGGNGGGVLTSIGNSIGGAGGGGIIIIEEYA